MEYKEKVDLIKAFRLENSSLQPLNAHKCRHSFLRVIPTSLFWQDEVARSFFTYLKNLIDHWNMFLYPICLIAEVGCSSIRMILKQNSVHYQCEAVEGNSHYCSWFVPGSLPEAVGLSQGARGCILHFWDDFSFIDSQDDFKLTS